MRGQDQLEVIAPDGEVRFYDLGADRGVVNIGRHPDNDVVLDDPSVAPFHAVLDHSQRPYHVVSLTPEEETRLAGRLLPFNVPTEMAPWDPVEIAGHTLMVLEGLRDTTGEGAASAGRQGASSPLAGMQAPSAGGKGLWRTIRRNVPGLPKPKPPVRVPGRKVRGALAAVERGGPDQQGAAAADEPDEASAASPPAMRHVEPPPDQLDEVIVTELSERAWTVDVEESATTRLTIVNGGDIVATFEVRVAGVAEEWVTISSPEVNLNEGERAFVTIAITPPRRPSSRAGGHPVTVEVTSPNHPERSSRMGAVLTINPYYAFTVGDLAPKQQTVTWSEHIGRVTLPIVNKGNSHALFRLEAADDERACSFEIEVPDESTRLVRQAEMTLPPGETVSIPVYVTPLSRQFAGMGQRYYSFTVTATLLEGEQTSRAVMGQLRSRPLIGPVRMALLALLFVLSIMFVFRPRIAYFRLEPETGIVRAGDAVRLNWRVSPFVTDLEIAGYDGEVEGASGSVSTLPGESVVAYELQADNWLSRLMPRWFSQARSETVIVIPKTPQIETFAVNRQDVIQGDEITLYWSVSDADEVVLKSNGVGEVIPPEEYVGQRTVAPAENTIYILEASSASGIDLQSMMVRVRPPELDIQTFSVEPARISAGESVSVTWAVSGAQSVRIAPLSADAYPPRGSTTFAPEETTDIILSASYGETEVRALQNVVVAPAVEREPPAIEFFTATPGQLTEGGDGQVQLAWSVTGEATEIEITGPDIDKLSGLAAKDVTTVQVDTSTVFILTASNGELSESQVAEVSVVEPASDSGSESESD